MQTQSQSYNNQSPRQSMTQRGRSFMNPTPWQRVQPMTKPTDWNLPKWLVGRSVLFFFVAFIACTVAFGYPMEMPLAITASLSVILFFYGAKIMCESWQKNTEREFLRNVFLIGMAVRFIWVLYCYFFFNMEHYNQSFGDGADTGWYMDYAKGMVSWFTNGHKMPETQNPITFDELRLHFASAVDDMGYPMWLALIYMIVGVENDVFVPFVVKTIVGAYCAVSIYRVAKRHYGIATARMAALFVALNPNMIYWCGTMFKEVELVFLCCLFVDSADRALTSGKKLSFRGLLPAILIGISLFFFRSALAIVVFLAVATHVVMVSNRVMSWGKKLIVGLLVGLTVIIGFGDSLHESTRSVIQSVQSNDQQVNMNWRSTRKGGNSFAKYASATIFAPLIITIPFPTFNVAEEGQLLQRQLSGGSYIKNIFSFFVIWILITMLLSGEWRRHVFILAYTLGYLASLVLSKFAQSGRFHMPILPMLMLFAAYGIQVAKTNPKMRRWFPIALFVEVLACLAWNWFKLKGRGMI